MSALVRELQSWKPLTFKHILYITSAKACAADNLGGAQKWGS
jgi:hypothetical protein